METIAPLAAKTKRLRMMGAAHFLVGIAACSCGSTSRAAAAAVYVPTASIAKPTTQRRTARRARTYVAAAGTARAAGEHHSTEAQWLEPMMKAVAKATALVEYASQLEHRLGDVQAPRSGVGMS